MTAPERKINRSALPILHIGHLKTATTFLQNSIFSDPDFGFGLPGGQSNRSHLTETIILNDSFDIDIESVARHFQSLEAEVAAQSLAPVWSSEGLIGDPTSRRYDRVQNLNRIRQIWKDARILITIREQTSMVMSLYNEYVHNGGRLPLREFIGERTEQPGYTPILRESYLMFDEVVEWAQKHYGAENIYVLPIEELRIDPERYYLRLSDLAFNRAKKERPSIASKPSPCECSIELNRIVNHLTAFNPRIPFHNSDAKKLISKTIRISDMLIPNKFHNKIRRINKSIVQERYRGIFSESNQRLKALTGLDLGRYGYEME